MNAICVARVTYVLKGYGDLTLTDEYISWNKSATSILVFGAMNTVTDDHLYLPLNEVSEVGKYTYFPGGGLQITDNKGKIYEFSFKRKKDFKVVYEYMVSHLIGSDRE